MTMTDGERAELRRMVKNQIAGRDVQDARVISALERVNRFRFVPDEFRAFACADGALPLVAGQTISQPYVVAKMTELLALTEESRVLEIGTGSGYQTAILAAGGRMVIPVGVSVQSLCLVTKDREGTVREREIFPVAFVPMVNAPSS